MHCEMRQQNFALAIYLQTEDLFGAAERKGLLNAAEQRLYPDVVAQLGYLHMDAHQLESAKRCFLRILSWPRLSPPLNRMDALRGTARYRKVRKDWVNVSKYSKKPSHSSEIPINWTGWIGVS